MTIWSEWEAGAWLIVPTNTRVKITGEAVMGAGVALEASRRSPGLAADYGSYLFRAGKDRHLPWVCNERRVICFPTKLHWRDPSTLTLIRSSANHLAALMRGGKIEGTVVGPRVGCGRGGLKWEDVEPMLYDLIKLGVRFIQ